MEAKAQARFVRVSPRKARMVINQIRGKSVQDAQDILVFSERAISEIIEKLLMSAVANAENNFGMDGDDLYVSETYVDEGPTLKRFQPRAQGAAGRINKRTSHITIVVAPREEE